MATTGRRSPCVWVTSNWSMLEYVSQCVITGDYWARQLVSRESGLGARYVCVPEWELEELVTRQTSDSRPTAQGTVGLGDDWETNLHMCVYVCKATGESKDLGPTTGWTECVSPATGRIPTGETGDPGRAAGQKASSWRDPHCIHVYVSH